MAENKLYDAAVKGDIRSLLDLLKEDPLIFDRVSFTCSNKTPLHIATICQHTAFVQEIAQRNPLLAAELDSHQSSSLHIASAKGYAEIVKATVSASPDMCLARDFHGRNPLHLAAINGQVMVFNELIKTSSLAVQEKADRGQTVLHLCVKHKQLQCRLFMWSLVVIMWSTVTSTVITYALSIAVVRPQKDRKPTRDGVRNTVYCG
ncbi:26S proteasome regulatory complex, subunit PSMD10 [Olea europaea subsp. europaea]|uniref:26S proteasome regulatory complex, subunit PSMD10 n=1 Tax=Olea europaea subsp. europaea TaxID=158383 RepID=A0A8S0R619_OLEEU|nr:26S proteasome regulatory complex, subunit PSMD10 [Olea europaea subsp. europaea]